MKLAKVIKPIKVGKSTTIVKKKPTKKLQRVEKCSKIAPKKIIDADSDAHNQVATPVVRKKKNKSKILTKNTKNHAKNNKLVKGKQLEDLKDIDPEFYEFIKKNDKKLLEFNVLDSDENDDEDEAIPKISSREENVSDSDSNEQEMMETANDADEKYHRPVSGQLEVASDESDFEEDEDIASGGVQKITLNLLHQWQMELEKPNVSIDMVRKAIKAFRSALSSISSEDNENFTGEFSVVGAAAFNGVVQLCVLYLQPAILNILGLTKKPTMALHKTKKWTKVRGCLRMYFTDLTYLIEQVSSANILSVLLKHLHKMALMIGSFSSVGKTLLKRLIVLWATGDESVRVLAFLCILRITRHQQVSMLNHVLKAMYLAYVRNSKFVSPTTLPGINFMRRSLVEMFALDLRVAYQHAFLYIRQLAIHLRNAVILKKKDSFQSVYNWQYINSLRLWVDLLGITNTSAELQPLLFPLVTITTGVIKLIPSAQYFPLRFHCIHALISLTKQTHIFIPVLPFIFEVLKSNTFKSKHNVVSMKPMQFTCILRLNKTQLAENGFRDEVIENVFVLTLEYLEHMSHSISFCDLVVPAVVAIKQYIKDCKNAKYARKMKMLVDKILENSTFIENERRHGVFDLKNLTQVLAWENRVRGKDTPLTTFYTSWVKTHEMKMRRQAGKVDDINEDSIPTIKRGLKAKTASKDAEDDVELFPSDTEDEDAIVRPKSREIGNAKLKNEKPKQKRKRKAEHEVQEKDKVIAENISMEGADDQVDIVKDLDLDDW